ncbi:DUF4307 domain-containing protein [Specibacter sp. RAF43]|uniref:DUF4307 domain-containing protein n=1 Tax=Specibacter sp. RAF43 TaxID=3233057 RepID=UPI003F988316
MTNSHSPAATSVANRYGTPKRTLTKRAKAIILTLVGVLALAWILWVTVGANSGVSQKLISYHVADSTMTTIELAVTKDPEATAACALQALNSTYAVVGWNIVTVGPDADAGSAGARTTAVHGEVRTDSLAVTGIVDSCWIVR